MEKSELLEALEGLTKKYEQHRSFIDKARAQAESGKFNAQVVQKVITDHEAKSSTVAVEVAPLLPKIHGLRSSLDAEKAKINDSKGGVDEQIQELELRQMIGELDDKAFEAEVAGLRERAAGANERIAAIDTDLGEMGAAVDRWAGLAGPAGHYRASDAGRADDVEELGPVDGDESGGADAAPPVAEADEPVGDEPSVEADIEMGSHATLTEMREDVSVVFEGQGESGAVVRVAASVEEEISIETAEGGEDLGDAPSADVQFGFEDDILAPAGVGSDEGGADEGAAEDGSGGAVEIDLAAVDAGEKKGDGEPAEDDKGEAPRRALLLYQEGTAEEQIYPFTGDIITIGRGRENDIQIKNDSKVSRYHCKIFRRGNNFYIEDQKSSNGSLVNGELVTDRRLFGGEEIVIGETFFRFRIME